MIELSHVTKTFGGKKALDELSLRVPQGAVYGLIGSNGAGKSTAIRHLTGIYRPDAGHIRVRLLAEKQPPFACRPLAPELEDVLVPDVLAADVDLTGGGLDEAVDHL